MKTGIPLRKFTAMFKEIPTFVLSIRITEDPMTKEGRGKGRTIKITI